MFRMQKLEKINLGDGELSLHGADYDPGDQNVLNENDALQLPFRCDICVLILFKMKMS